MRYICDWQKRRYRLDTGNVDGRRSGSLVGGHSESFLKIDVDDTDV